MVRQISDNAQEYLEQSLGVEPAIIIQVQWVDGGSIYTYSDKDLNANEGKILAVSDLDNSVVVQGVQSGTSGDSQQISITIDDSDGTIKNIINQNDIHKQPCWVYQWFTGLSLDDKFLIFKGQISSPMQWNEGDRTVSFDIITRIEDAEVGFSMEEGDFTYVPEYLQGQPWPLIFGRVKNSPALKTRSPRTGILKTGFGIHDYMLAPRAEQARQVCCPVIFIGFRTSWAHATNVWGAAPLKIEAQYNTDARCECKKRAIYCEAELNLAVQQQYEYEEIEIINGSKFPQQKFITLNIAGAKVSGKFYGDTFRVERYIHPALETVPIPEIKNFGCDTGYGTDNSANTDPYIQSCVLPPECSGWQISMTSSAYLVGANDTSLEQEAWNYLSSFREVGFFWADPGSEVTLIGDDEYVYIVNLLPSTVHYLKAWKTFSVSNLRQFTTVPNTYWYARNSNFQEYLVSEVVLTQSLSSRGDGWEDDIYVTLTSTIGPNMVDIMKWLINKYTNFTWDDSFDEVRTKMVKYPMNFRVPGRKNILQLLQEMSFQNRCALTLRNDQFHLTYLSEEPAEDGIITESDVLANSLIMDHTNTEDLVTKLIAEWRPSLDLEDPYKVIVRYNVRKYGTQEETFDFYCFNTQKLVTKSATFWLIRMANTWKRIMCQVPISKLALESIDGCYVNLPDIADEIIKCRVETAVYNSEDHAIDLVLQTPVRAGEMTAYPFHYPSQISIDTLHPTNEDLQFGNAGGSGPNVDVDAPSGHVLGSPLQLTQGFSFGSDSPCSSISGGATYTRPIDLQGRCRPDHGDQQPSDIDDTTPTVPIHNDNTEVPPQQSPVNEYSQTKLNADANNIQQEGTNSALQNQLTGVGNTGTGSTQGAGTGDGAGSLNDTGGTETDDGDKQKEYADELPDDEELRKQNKCFWSLTIYSITVTTVRIANGEWCDDRKPLPPYLCNRPNGWCYCSEPEKYGCWVGNQVAEPTETLHFDSASARDAAAQALQSLIDSKTTVGANHPVYYTKFDYIQPGCEMPEPGQEGGMIGHQYEAGNDGSWSVFQLAAGDACDLPT